MKVPSTRLSAVAVTALVAASLAACGGPQTETTSSDGDSTTISIGASLPLSGPLAGFGSFQKWGYEHAVEEINEAGGIEIDGEKRQVELTLVDDKTDPNVVSQNTSTLISKDQVDGLLGSCTPALVTAGAVIADRAEVPFVTGCAPLGSFAAVKDWTWAWDIFFAESDATLVPFDTIEDAGVETNKKIAILHDNGPDGQALGKVAWPATAAERGYEVVANVEFPTDNTDFSAAVQEAKSSGADILLVDAVTPQSVSIRKQMATAGYNPKFIQMEKGAEPSQFAEALGDLADGVTVAAYWDSSFPYPGAAELGEAFEEETGQSQSQHIADSYTAAMVLMRAIEAAGSTDPEAVNEAIGQTDAEYPVGRVQFADDNTARLDIAQSQWQDGKPVIVWPEDRATGTLSFPAS